jgi:hypothetical protein
MVHQPNADSRQGGNILNAGCSQTLVGEQLQAGCLDFLLCCATHGFKLLFCPGQIRAPPILIEYSFKIVARRNRIVNPQFDTQVVWKPEFHLVAAGPARTAVQNSIFGAISKVARSIARSEAEEGCRGP